MQDSDRPDDARTGANSPARRGRGRQGRPRRIGQFVRGLVLTLFCLVSLTVGTVAGNFYQRSSLFRELFKSFLSSPGNAWRVITQRDPFANYTVDKNFPSQPHTMNILVLGCDSDYYDDKPMPIKGTPGRSDAIMVAHIDFDKNTLNVLSIPRDTAVPIPGHRGYHKVNAAHSYGGNDLSAQTIREDFGINSDYTISLDFDSFQKVVDAVHGVDLTVDKKLDYDDNWGNLHIHLKPGYQHLNGYRAMGYVRIRHSDDDLHRTERQHQFIEALRKQVMSPSNFVALPDVISAITDDIKSNMTRDQELTLVHWATQLDKNNIQLSTLPSSEDRKFVYADPNKAAAVIAGIFFSGDPRAVTLNVGSRNQLIALNARSVRRRHIRRRSRTDASTPHAADGTDALSPTELTPVNAPMDDTGAPSGVSSAPGDSAPSAPANNSKPDGGTPKAGSDGTSGGQTGGTAGNGATARPESEPHLG